MPSSCPICGRRIRVGSLRCRHCNGDAREAEPEGLALSDAIGDDIEAMAIELLGEHQVRRMKAVARLKEIAPAVVTWASLEEHEQGPQPEVPQEFAAEVAALLAVLEI